MKETLIFDKKFFEFLKEQAISNRIVKGENIDIKALQSMLDPSTRLAKAIVNSARRALPNQRKKIQELYNTKEVLVQELELLKLNLQEQKAIQQSLGPLREIKRNFSSNLNQEMLRETNIPCCIYPNWKPKLEFWKQCKDVTDTTCHTREFFQEHRQLLEQEIVDLLGNNASKVGMFNFKQKKIRKLAEQYAEHYRNFFKSFYVAYTQTFSSQIELNNTIVDNTISKEVLDKLQHEYQTLSRFAGCWKQVNNNIQLVAFKQEPSKLFTQVDTLMNIWRGFNGDLRKTSMDDKIRSININLQNFKKRIRAVDMKIVELDKPGACLEVLFDYTLYQRGFSLDDRIKLALYVGYPSLDLAETVADNIIQDLNMEGTSQRSGIIVEVERNQGGSSYQEMCKLVASKYTKVKEDASSV